MVEILVVLAIGLAMITLVGHGIWVLVRGMFSAFEREATLPTRPTAATESSGACPRCGIARHGVSSTCSVCGWPNALPDGNPRLRALAATLNQVRRFAALGLIDSEAHARLTEAIEAQQQRLAGGRASEVAQPAARQTPAPRQTPPAAPVPPHAPSPPTPEPDAYELEAVEVVEEEKEESIAEVIGLAARAPLEPEQRVREFMARQAASPAPSVAPAPATPKRDFSKLLTAFMEEKNIRWGELVGGLLIVCCSIALVISFWSKIAERPFLKFFAFNGVTAGLFGIGIYTHRRWKLQTTSHGLLTIATLLVPLNFLAIAAFSRGGGGADPLIVAGELVSIGLFSVLVYLGGRVLLAGSPALLTVAVITASVAELVVRRFVEPGKPLELLYGIALIPIACYLLTTGWMIFSARRLEGIDEPQANAIFKFHGISSFAVLVPLGLLLAKTGAMSVTLHRLSPLVVLCGFAPLATGLLLWRKITEPRLASVRTAGASIGVLGAGILVAAVILAWPDPAQMLPVAVLDFLILAAVAHLFELPAAHALAGPCLVIAYLLGFHLITHRVFWHTDTVRLIKAIFSADSGRALVPMVVLLSGAAALWERLARRAEAQIYLCLTAAVAAVSLVLALWFGFGRAGDPSGATWVIACYAIVAFVIAGFTGRQAAAWAGSALLLLAIAQGVVFRFSAQLELSHPWITALLAHAALLTVLTLAVRATKWRGTFTTPAMGSALAVSSAAALLVFWETAHAFEGELAAAMFVIAAIWLVVAVNNRWAELFAAFQVMLTLAVASSVIVALQRQTWYQQSPRPWLEPWTVQAVAISLAILCLAWTLMRVGLRKLGMAKETWAQTAASFLNPPWPAVDRIVGVAVLAMLAALAVYAALPGVAQELSPSRSVRAGVVSGERAVPPMREFEIAAIPHQHAAAAGSWILLGLVGLELAISFWDRFRGWKVLALLLVVSTTCPLLAALWESQVAVASALRWILPVFLLLGSIVIWERARLRQWATRFDWPGYAAETAGLGDSARALLLVLAIGPLLAMAAYVGFAAVMSIQINRLTLIMARVLGTVFFAAAIAALIRRTTSRSPYSGMLALVVGAAPLLVLVLNLVATGLEQHPIVGPDPSAIFSRIGLSTSYALPVLVMALTFIGYAVRDGALGFAFAAGLLLNLSVTAAYMLALAGWGQPLDTTQWFRVAQLNGIVSGCFALAWLGAGAAWSRRRAELGKLAQSPLLFTQVALAVSFDVLFVGTAVAALFVNPKPTLPLVEAAGILGWIAIAVTGAAIVWLDRRTVGGGRAARYCGGLVLVVWTVALLTLRWDNGDWLAYHALMVVHVALGAMFLFVGERFGLNASTEPESHREPGVAGGSPSRQSWANVWHALGWVSAMAVVTILLSLRAVFGDPAVPRPTIAGLVCASLLLVGVAAKALEPALLYICGPLLNLAATIWWLNRGVLRQWSTLLEVNIVMLALPAVAWLLLELRLFRPRLGSRRIPPAFHQFAAQASLLALTLLVVLGLAQDLVGRPQIIGVWPQWLALIATAMAVGACLWDAEQRSSVAQLYLLGLVACGVLLDQINVGPQMLQWSGTMVLGAYVLATSYLWSRRAGLLQLADALHIPRGADKPLAGLEWLVPASCTLALIVLALVYHIELTYADQSLRVLASKAAIAQAVAIGLLARGERRSQLQILSLTLGVIGAVAFGWAWLEPGASVLDRAVVLAVVVAPMIALYGLGLGKFMPRQTEWTAAAGKLVVPLVIVEVATMGFVLAMELKYFLAGQPVPISPAAIAAVAAALLGQCAAALVAALVPGRDPLGLSERGRMAYVYAAEALLAIAFLHIRLTMPWLFTGFFQRYWPLIVMLISFLGVTVSEIFRRQNRPVMAEPLERTGALLPLLPVLAFWIVPTPAVDFSLLLLTVSIFYAGLSVARKSLVFGLGAVIAANGALWSLLHKYESLSFFEHPQLWLIPPALCVLVAAHLNRKQLPTKQLTTIRYCASIVVYVSSTADIFINGVAQAPWLPLVLAAISIAGILAGIMFRVLAWLILGICFLVLALLTIIWYAAVDLHQTWLWSVTGIIAGILIIVLFAVFEKKRQTVLQLVEQLKQWNP